MREVIFFCLTLLSFNCMGQDWFPLGYGFESGSARAVHDLEIGPLDNNIYVSGVFFSTGSGLPVKGVSKWNPAEGEWSMEYSNGSGYVREIGFYQDTLFAGGYLSLESFENDKVFHKWRNGEWEFDANGPSSGFSGANTINDLLYVVGQFQDVGGLPTYGLTTYDGVSFTSFFGDYAKSYHVIEDVIEFQNEIYITGQSLSLYPEFQWNGLAKLGDNVLEVAHEDFAGNFFQMWPHCVEVYDGELYIGGLFHEGQGFAGNGIVRFDGQEMHDVGGGVNLSVYDMKTYKGELYVVGSFGRIGEESVWDNLEAGEKCNGAAKWDGETWICLFLQEDADFGAFRTLEILNDTMYVGGGFPSLLGDTAMSMIAARRIFPKNQPQLSLDFSLYPNPSQGEIHLDFGQLLRQDAEAEIYNALGQRLLSRALTTGHQTYVFDSRYPAGLYYLQVEMSGVRVSKKFMILE